MRSKMVTPTRCVQVVRWSMPTPKMTGVHLRIFCNESLKIFLVENILSTLMGTVGQIETSLTL